LKKRAKIPQKSKNAYNKLKRSLNKDNSYSLAKKEIKNVKNDIDSNIGDLISLENTVHSITKKAHGTPDSVLESFPIETLRELCGDFSKKITFKDICTLQDLRKKSIDLLEKQEDLINKERLLKIEMLEKQIHFLINYTNEN
jgi:hypothetical protein